MDSNLEFNSSTRQPNQQTTSESRIHPRTTSRIHPRTTTPADKMRPLLRTLPPRPLLLANRRPLFSATTPRLQQDNDDGKEASGSIPTTEPQPVQTPAPEPRSGVQAQVQRKISKPPFPINRLSVGTDICHVPRIQKVLEARGGIARFASRILTEDEVEDALGRGYRLRPEEGGEQGEQVGLSREVVFLAGR